MTEQGDFFESIGNDPLDAANAPNLDCWLDIISVVNQCLRNCPLSREQIVDRINLCLRHSQHKVTLIQLNKWLSPSQANCIPAWVLPALCWAVQSDAPFTALLQPIGRKVVDMRGDKMRQLTELQLEAADRARQAKALQKQMQQLIESSK